jgi:hypothetical protein
MLTKATMVTEVAWTFPTQSLRRAETQVGLHVKCPLLLFDSNQKSKVSTNFIKTTQYQISLKSVQLFSSRFMRRLTDGQSDFKCKIILLDFIHRLNYKIIKLRRFGSRILLPSSCIKGGKMKENLSVEPPG